MDNESKEKEAALRDLAQALLSLSSRQNLPLRDRAVVLTALEELIALSGETNEFDTTIGKAEVSGAS